MSAETRKLETIERERVSTDRTLLARYDVSTTQALRDRNKHLNCVIGALVRQIEALGSTPAVSEMDIVADPQPVTIVHNTARNLYYLHSKEGSHVG